MFLNLLLTLTLNPAFAKDTVHCEKFQTPLTGGYCITAPEVRKNKDIVYHFHGSGGNETYWNDDYFYTGQIRSYWQEHGIQTPTVVSISFGTHWLLAKKNSSPASGLFEILVNQIIPKVEANLGGTQRSTHRHWRVHGFF